MATKLLLIKDVDNLGRSGAIVGVKPGFARNYLIPQGFAMVANKKALRMQASLQEKRQNQAVVDKTEAEQLAAKIQGTSLTVEVKVDHEGHMYGSVTANDINHLIESQLNLKLDKKAVQLRQPIKAIGEDYKVTVRLKEGVTADIQVNVRAEGSEEKAAAKA
jgi:large subunit ribosomal protein L9